MKTVTLMTIILSIFGVGNAVSGKVIDTQCKAKPAPVHLMLKFNRLKKLSPKKSIKSISRTLNLNYTQQSVLKSSLSIGKKIGIGKFLAAVTYQESSFGLFPVSYNHYGVGSVGYVAYQIVMKHHPWLKRYFKGKNWANVLIQRPNISLWVSGYFIHYCYDKADDNWVKALNLYRYGYQGDGDYPVKIFSKVKEI